MKYKIRTQTLRTFLNLFTGLLLIFATHTVIAENKITFYHYDLLGSPVAATDEQGNIVWREEYSPWGKKLLNQDATKDNVRGYTGHVHDKETGLTYMQARYYDPDIVRFMGVDPVGFQEGNTLSFNSYKYGNNNPFKFTDPNGEYESETTYEDGSSMDIPIGNSSTPMDLAGPPEEKKERVERGFFAKSWDEHGYHIMGSMDSMPGLRTAKTSVLGLMALGSINKIAPKTTTLYRAVSSAELDDIARYGLRTTSGGYEFGKLFATSAKDAAQYGRYNFKLDGIPNHLISVSVPNSVMKKAKSFTADSMTAISIPAAQLHKLNASPINISPLVK